MKNTLDKFSPGLLIFSMGAVFYDPCDPAFKPVASQNPTPKGIQVPVGMSPSKAASLLCKVAYKATHTVKGKFPGKPHHSGGRSIAKK